MLTNLFAKIEGARQEFKVQIPEPVMLDWMDENSWKRSTSAYVALRPVRVEVTFNIKGEQLFERFDVDGLYLDVSSTRMAVGESRHDIATFVLVERAEGVSITRATD